MKLDLLILKIILLGYIIYIQYFNNKTVLNFFNKKIIKIIFLILIIIYSYYDLTVSILLTIILIMNMIMVNPDLINDAKKTFNKEKFSDNSDENSDENTDETEQFAADEEYPETNEDPEDTKYSTLEEQENFSARNQIEETETEEVKKTLDIDTVSVMQLDKGLLPTLNNLDNIQNNIYDNNYYSLNLEFDEFVNKMSEPVITGFDESKEIDIY